jgi:hypothetical protein
VTIIERRDELVTRLRVFTDPGPLRERLEAQAG